MQRLEDYGLLGLRDPARADRLEALDRDRRAAIAEQTDELRRVRASRRLPDRTPKAAPAIGSAPAKPTRRKAADDGVTRLDREPTDAERRRLRDGRYRLPDGSLLDVGEAAVRQSLAARKQHRLETVGGAGRETARER